MAVVVSTMVLSPWISQGGGSFVLSYSCLLLETGSHVLTTKLFPSVHVSYPSMQEVAMSADL